MDGRASGTIVRGERVMDYQCFLIALHIHSDRFGTILPGFEAVIAMEVE